MRMAISLEEALGRVPGWAGQTLQTASLGGGLTNQNIRVDVGGEALVLRLAGEGTDLLGINRRHEYAASVAAAAAGVGPEVIHFIEPEGCLVTRFVVGRPVAPEAMRHPDNLRRVAAALRAIHAMPPIPGTFSPFRVVEAYERTARAHGVDTFPDNYAWLLERKDQIETAFMHEPYEPCPCHNDLLNANFLDDGRLRVLDWEYAGMGDPGFDLANFSVNHELSSEADRLLLGYYFGEATARRLARHRLMKIMSDFREAMWGVVQQGISALEFDFREYADKHFRRMTMSFDDPRCASWLAELVTPGE
jgi:thiamine kinase-like enzyme